MLKELNSLHSKLLFCDDDKMVKGKGERELKFSSAGFDIWWWYQSRVVGHVLFTTALGI